MDSHNTIYVIIKTIISLNKVRKLEFLIYKFKKYKYIAFNTYKKNKFLYMEDSFLQLNNTFIENIHFIQSLI